MDKKINKILFIVFQELQEAHGISSKIRSQVKAFSNNGCSIDLYSRKYTDSGVYELLNDKIINEYSKHYLWKIQNYLDYSSLMSIIRTNEYSCVYIRYIHNCSPSFLSFLNKLKKLNINIILEIPTFPYDGEYKKASFFSRIKFKIEKYNRYKLKKYINYIVTFSSDKEIFNIPAINISNAIDFSQIRISNSHFDTKKRELNFIGVASFAEWHGYDRLIIGLNKYLNNSPEFNVKFYIIGGGSPSILDDYQSIINKYKLHNNVFLLGPKYGKELDFYFDKSHLGVGCLGCHRKNIEEVKSLKNVEYAARGIPFLYSEKNNDFDCQPYVIKVSSDDSAIDVEWLVKKYIKISNSKISHLDIRSSIEDKMSWNLQIKKIINFF